MRLIALFIGFFGLFGNGSKSDLIESKVYTYAKATVEPTKSGERKLLMDGETTQLQKFEIQSFTLLPGKRLHGSESRSKEEVVIFVKEGQLKITLNGESQWLGPGSVALIMPGDAHRVENTSGSNATCYVIQYSSKQPLSAERGKLAGGSKLLNWEGIPFTAHDKGGIRRYFDRKSAMSERIEMHVTTLNPGIKSHEPHTHLPGEIVVMMEGTTEMEIRGGIYPGSVGDIYFLGSNIPHAIRNIGTKPCMYLAFQWE